VILLNGKEKICKIFFTLFLSSKSSFSLRIPIQTFKLANIMSNDAKSIKTLLNLFRDEQQGLLFVKDSVLPEHTFIAIEAIWWSIEHCEDIQDEKTALALFEVEKKI
jgi:hypothetical protein